MSRQLEGTVLRIERGSIHDGQGLRTVVFLKGCPLSCLWCSTPESQNSLPEKGYMADRCTACGTCVAACPSQALKFQDDALLLDASLCNCCFDCVAACPQDAHLQYGATMTVGQVLEEISKDEIFFFHSGGGLTLSGGECLLQADFSAQLLKQSKLQGIHTAVETSLHAQWQEVGKILPYTDVLFVDLKHCDRRAHKRCVGVNNDLIKQNIRRLDDSDFLIELHLRIPLIPGFNDTDENLRCLAALAGELAKLKEIEILPYHRLGVGTYRHLNRKYQLEGVSSFSAEYLSERLEFLRQQAAGIRVKLGGGFV